MGLACDARAVVTEGLTARTHACRSGTDSYNPDCYYIRERVRQRRVANSRRTGGAATVTLAVESWLPEGVTHTGGAQRRVACIHKDISGADASS
jgi:hypothetical protein